MKRNPFKMSSILFLLLVVVSLGSTIARVRNYVPPSIPLRPDSYEEALHLIQNHVRDETFWCDRSDNRTDICYMRGNVHLIPGNSSSLVLHSIKETTWHGEEIIWPYPRKWDHSTLQTVEPIVLKSMYSETEQPRSTDVYAVCDVIHPSPLLVFSAGGYTGNPFHDFNDVIIPLFINSRMYGGEVVFGVPDGRDWWMEKFSPFFKLLSNHKMIDMNNADQIHCFSEATVGLRIHAELAIYPSLMKHNETVKDFQELLHQAYGSEPLFVGNISSSCRSVNGRRSRCRPKLVLFARKHSRIILNQDEVVKLARREGFEVEVLDPSGQTDLKMLYRALHTADVMMGVHGAALTHMLFMRPRSVFIQIVPLGTDWPSYTFYQEPAENGLGLQYLEYRVTPEESTLAQTYSADDLAITDPEAFIAKNWEVRKKLYLVGQNISLSLSHMKLTLAEAKKLALEAFPRRRLPVG